ncbi:discoidin domain-containing protein [Occallatibacter riparius]|uniref:Discoidin domain-containing protein n=1 Tax=Occallatibacter riparius TaxID=1002689 RepID=A0A9J7BWM9_9BACT|nr:discoidin domain-containing protein [Occallatibacter riparius]UWZ85278.1 discoidin domain-containing protein [Occallatibacter riparius]
MAAMAAVGATGQVTTDGSTTVNTVPYFKNSATQLSNSPIVVNGNNVGIGTGTTTPPRSTLDIVGTTATQRVVEIFGAKDAAVGAPVTITGGTLSNGGPTYRGGGSIWQATATGQQLTVDLGGSVTAINGISFSAYYAGDYRYIPASYSIDYSTDNNTYTNVVSVTSNTRADVFNSFSGLTARYIRLTVNAFQSGQSVSNISGLRVYTTQGAGMSGQELWSTLPGINSNNVVLSTTGNVGVGTTTPTVSLDVNGSIRAGGNGADLPAATNYNPVLSGGFASPTIGRLFIGDGTGWKFYFSKRSSSVTTDLITFADSGYVGIGAPNPQAKLEINGGLRFTGDVNGAVQTTAWTGVLCGGDYAEAVDPVGDKQAYGPGDVLVISDGEKGDIRKSSQPYATTVAGVFATKPGVVGRRQTFPDTGEEIPMAMVGIVPTNVTTENGSIHRGDLLVTSAKTGYAMKGTDRTRMLGAVIGKAMGSLEAGDGVIEVLVTLQ